MKALGLSAALGLLLALPAASSAQVVTRYYAPRVSYYPAYEVEYAPRVAYAPPVIETEVEVVPRVSYSLPVEIEVPAAPAVSYYPVPVAPRAPRVVSYRTGGLGIFRPRTRVDVIYP